MLLYNSLSNKKESLKTLKPNRILMYVCGITPYDTTHLGHAFTYTVFDVLVRFLSFKGYEINYTQNVTDIDDDILKKADELKKDWKNLGDFWTNRFLEDLKGLNIKMPNHFVRATDSIPTIIKTVKALIEKGYAYESSGNVYFNVSKFPNYGKLSKYSKNKMIKLSKERGANPNDPLKLNHLDFILWQKSKKGEPSWESPWGPGRPGWHIECSAMNSDYLGPQIDIHGGGLDLIYPHHESEIAQSESYTNKTPFAKFWLHTAMLEYKGQKMSKSLNNLVMVKDLLKNYTPSEIRWVLLSHRFHKKWEFREEELLKARQKLVALNKQTTALAQGDQAFDEFTAALEDNLDTPKALQLLKKMAAKQRVQVLDILGFPSSFTLSS